jgi:hypothetical protein
MNLSLEAVLSSVDLGWKKMHWTCGLADCHSKRFLRSVPQSCMGIVTAKLSASCCRILGGGR